MVVADQILRRKLEPAVVTPSIGRAELQTYRSRAEALSDVFAALPPIEGLRVNAPLTLDENLADLIGVAIAYRAYTVSLNGTAPPVLDGFTGPQRFFLSYARMWRMKVQPGYLRQWLLTLPYSPEQFRTNTPLSQTDAFYEAFAVRERDRLFVPADRRVRVW